MKKTIMAYVALLTLAFAVNGFAMGAGEPQQPEQPLPTGQENWEPPEKQFEAQYPQEQGDEESDSRQQESRQWPQGGTGNSQEGVSGPQEPGGSPRPSDSEGNQTGTSE